MCQNFMLQKIRVFFRGDTEMSKGSKDNTGLQNQLTELQEKYDRLEKERNELREKYDRLEKESTNLKDNIANQINTLAGELGQRKNEIGTLFTEIKKDATQHYKETIIVQHNTEIAERLYGNLSDTKKLIEDKLSEQLQENTNQLKDLMAQRQETGKLNEEVKVWRETAIDFFESLERMLANSDDNQSREKIKKVVQDFEKLVNQHGLERINPSPGDEIKEKLYQFKDYEESDQFKPGTVIRCIKWGYKIHGQLYQNKYAEVILAKAPKQNQSVTNSTNGNDATVAQGEEEADQIHNVGDSSSSTTGETL